MKNGELVESLARAYLVLAVLELYAKGIKEVSPPQIARLLIKARAEARRDVRSKVKI